MTRRIVSPMSQSYAPASAWSVGVGSGLVANRETGSPVVGNPNPVSLVRWRSEVGAAQVFRVVLHPLRKPGAVPTPKSAIYPSQPAGGNSGSSADIYVGQPLQGPCYVVVRWGTGAYQTALVADWPRCGGGFDLAGDNVEIDGLVTSGSGEIIFAATLAPGGRSAPESVPLVFSQELSVKAGTGDADIANVPSYAQRVRVTSNINAAVPMVWLDHQGNPFGIVEVVSTMPLDLVVPAKAVALAAGGLLAAAIGLTWIISP